MSNSDDSSAGPRRRARPVRLLTAAVFALAGLIFVTSFNTSKGTNIRTDASLLKLSDLIQERSQNNLELEKSTATARGEVDALADRDNGSTKAEDAKLAALRAASGTEELSGKGLTVTLNDAPPTPRRASPTCPSRSPTTW